jgi:hypothetical protein
MQLLQSKMKNQSLKYVLVFEILFNMSYNQIINKMWLNERVGSKKLKNQITKKIETVKWRFNKN